MNGNHLVELAKMTLSTEEKIADGLTRCVDGVEQADQGEIVDLFEPVTFDWDEDVFQAKEAARKYAASVKEMW